MPTNVVLANGEDSERWNLADGIYRRFQGGRIAEERPFNATDNQLLNHLQALDAMDTGQLLAKLRNALANNRSYLDKVNTGTATNADHLAQVSMLTRQISVVLMRSILETQ